MTPHELAEQLRQDYLALKLGRASKPRHLTANHAHSAGHPCDRYLVLLRVGWQFQAPLTDPVRAAMFEEGHHQEHALSNDLEDLDGWKVAMRHTPVALPPLELVGEIDLLIRHLSDPRFYVADIKSCSPGTFQSVQTAEDAWNHRLWFVRQWGPQVLLYLAAALANPQLVPHLHDGAALLLLKEKTTGDLRIVVIPWEPERMDAIRKRLMQVNQAVTRIRAEHIAEAGTATALRAAVPPPIRDVKVCPSCAFATFCAPELFLPVGSAEILDHPELEDILEERERHVEGREKYEELDREAKGILKSFRVTMGPRGKAHLLCGRHLITVTQVQPRGRPAYLSYEFWRRPDSPTGLEVHHAPPPQASRG